MRQALVVSGMTALVVHAICGALMMNDRAVVAASGLPLAETIAAMEAAGQPYTVVPGIVFAVLGIASAAGWALLNKPRAPLPTWLSLTLWAAIVAFSAPAYVLASFANLNSVGDTFPDWHAEAAFALEARFYLISGLAAIVAVATPSIRAVGSFRAILRTRPNG